jgi:hypothetical protein
MTFFTLSRPGSAPIEYPSLGFTALVDGAVLDGSLFSPALTTPPDAFWSVGGSAEANVSRWDHGEISQPPPEPADGAALVWDAAANRYVPTSTALSAAYVAPVNVRAHGAVGNGVADDTAAIQAALDAAATGSRKVYLPGGTYKVTSTLVVAAGVTTEGESRKSTVFQTTTDMTAIRMTGGEGQGLRDFKLANSFAGTRTTFDIEVINPFNPKIENVEIALGQTSLIKGGIHIYKVAGQPGDTACFMPELSKVLVRNGVLAVEDVTDGKATDCFFWGTYTGAPGTVQLTRSSNWTFQSVDVVPPQGDAGGYLLTDLNNFSIVGGLLDGSYDAIMTGHGIKSSGFVRGLSVLGAKFFNLGRSGMKLSDVRRSSFIGNIFVQCNKADSSYPDVDLAACSGNVFIGNTHGAPVARTNKGKVYVEDGSSADNAYRTPAVEVNSSIVPNGHYYATPLTTLADSSVIQSGVPAVNWPTETPLASKSTNYTITKEDLFHNRTIMATSAVTITLPSAGSVHAGDRATIKNGSGGSVTIATTSSQTVDGSAPTALASNAAATYMSDGANWRTL